MFTEKEQEHFLLFLILYSSLQWGDIYSFVAYHQFRVGELWSQAPGYLQKILLPVVSRLYYCIVQCAVTVSSGMSNKIWIIARLFK